MEVGKIDLPSMLLYGEVIRKYELLVTAYGVSTNSHLNFICVCLINELLSTNTLSKYKYEMRRMICKSQDMNLRQEMTCLQETNNYLSTFTGTNYSKIIPKEELNGILLHVVLHK